MEAYKKHLSRDSKLKPLLKTKVVLPEGKTNITLALVSSILSQQLSTKVAKVMYQRFLDLFKGRTPKASDILALPVSKIKAIGISQRKAEYIHHVAAFIVENKVTNAKLRKMSDDDVIELLVQIKGVGRWTVEMLLIFTLGREDVFALDDYGIQKAMIHLFKWEELGKKELRQKMLETSESWSPYRSYACLCLWRSLD